MTLQLTMNAAQTELTIVSDKRKHAAVPAQTENFTITVEASGETKVYSGIREISPAVPASVDPISISDSSGALWSVLTDDGVTAVYRKAS